MAQEKILVCGDVEGQFKRLFERVSSVNEKSGPFSMLLCVGEFFGDKPEDLQPYQDGFLKVPVLTFVLGPLKREKRKHYPDLRGCELAPNVVYLGPHGHYKCSSGLSIAYVSGLASSLRDGESLENYSKACLEQLATPHQKVAPVDVLLSNEWPACIFNFTSSLADVDLQSFSSTLVAYVAKVLRPRYHFSAGRDIHYERLLHRNHQVLNEPQTNVTRFISLAKVCSATNSKWLYAFNIVPASKSTVEELNRQPADVTENPYGNIQQRDVIRKEEPKHQQFFYNLSPMEEDDTSRGKGTRRKGEYSDARKRKMISPDECWFCPSRLKLEKHLIVSVGMFCYVSLAKGGLVNDHLLIVPLEHCSSTLHLDRPYLLQIEKYKSCLVEMFKVEGKGVVFFERNYRSPHLQIQVVPVPKEVFPFLSTILLSVAEGHGFDLELISKDLKISHLASGRSFFWIELPTGQKFFLNIQGQFPLNFAREFLSHASVLNVPNGEDWAHCILPLEEEEALGRRMKERFKPFDFVLQEDSDSDDSGSDDGS